MTRRYTPYRFSLAELFWYWTVALLFFGWAAGYIAHVNASSENTNVPSRFDAADDLSRLPR